MTADCYASIRPSDRNSISVGPYAEPMGTPTIRSRSSTTLGDISCTAQWPDRNASGPGSTGCWRERPAIEWPSCAARRILRAAIGGCSSAGCWPSGTSTSGTSVATAGRRMRKILVSGLMTRLRPSYSGHRCQPGDHHGRRYDFDDPGLSGPAGHVDPHSPVHPRRIGQLGCHRGQPLMAGERIAR